MSAVDKTELTYLVRNLKLRYQIELHEHSQSHSAGIFNRHLIVIKLIAGTKVRQDT